jgi:hypothetical protein
MLFRPEPGAYRMRGPRAKRDCYYPSGEDPVGRVGGVREVSGTSAMCPEQTVRDVSGHNIPPFEPRVSGVLEALASLRLKHAMIAEGLAASPPLGLYAANAVTVTPELRTRGTLPNTGPDQRPLVLVRTANPRLVLSVRAKTRSRLQLRPTPGEH